MGGKFSAFIGVPCLFAAGVMAAIISSKLKKPSKVKMPDAGTSECNNLTQDELDDIVKARKFATYTAIAGICLGVFLFLMLILLPEL